MELTPAAQQSLDFSKSCFLQGMCTAKELMKAIKSIYIDDANRQIEFLQEQGFTINGARKHAFKLDKGEELI